MTRLLLIEDTPSLQLVYASILRNVGHDVTCASTAESGLNHFRAAQYPIILLDLVLPDRDGLDLMADCLTLAPQTRVIVITANATIRRAVEAMRAGAFDFLVKPFSDRKLRDAVSNAQASDLFRPRNGVNPTFTAIPAEMSNDPTDSRHTGTFRIEDFTEHLSGLSLAQIEQFAIEAAIARHAGSVPRAAKELGVAPSTLYRKRETWFRTVA